MGVGRGSRGSCPLDFEIWNFSITFLSKNVVSLVFRRKNKISSLWPSGKIFMVTCGKIR